MTDHADLDKIKGRIADLLRMADDTSSPHEAAIAASRARKLMDKYQLDAFDVSEKVAQLFATEAATRVYAAVPQYVATLGIAVAKYNDVIAAYEWDRAEQTNHAKRTGRGKTFGKKLMFKGYEADTACARDMLGFLIGTVDRLCKAYMTQQGMTRYNVKIGTAFKDAAASAIQMTLASITKERQALTLSNGTSLMVVKMKAVEEEFGAAKYGTSKRSVAIDESTTQARVVGWREGSKVEVVKKVAA